MKNILRILPILIIRISFAQNQDFKIEEYYPIEKSHSFISFSATYMGYAKVRGSFEDFSGTFRYDPNDLEKTSVSFSINVSSIDTNLDFRDKDLKSEDWLNVEKYPLILFVSNGVNTSNGRFEVLGDLTIKGITKQVSLKMNPSSGILKDIRGDLQVIMTGSIEIDRTQYGVVGEKWSKIKEGIAGVSNIIEIEFSMLGKQIQLENQLNWVRDESRPPGKLYKFYQEGGVEAVIQTFIQLNDKSKQNFKWLNTVGYLILKQGNLEDALQIFTYNMNLFPEESDIYEAIGETYALLGELENARTNYQKSLQLNNSNVNALEILRYLKQN